MEFSNLIILLSILLSLLSQTCQSTRILVDGVSEWKDPTVHVGDSVIFKHKYHYNLYIFQNERAFNLCNFTQATLLSKPNTTSYTWHPSRSGFFYFTFNNGSLSSTCQGSKKLAVKVSSTPAPESSTISPPTKAPAPSSGGAVSSSPAYPWPFRPKEAASPAPEPYATSPAMIPSLVPDKGGGIPFINSNPAVPLPTGEVDSATIRPLPMSSHGGQVMMGCFGVQMTVLCMVLLLL
ncbi:early nodulin-like protein 9 [Humulus lupulus]|uniref:early nodulin-like protein 9 n=1 Tax=Humulus lupulus TaxID=3486 RepID=UPI002B40CC8E|nr:early nodulin-like protein 9 [Humulus lupulus]